MDHRQRPGGSQVKTIYPMTAEIVEWMNHNLVPIEGAVFRHFRGIIKLIRIVDRVEEGRAPKYAALSAIKRYNERNQTTLTYEEVRDRTSSHVFLPAGDWAAYVDDIHASNAIITGDHDDLFDALEHAHPDISWILLWLADKQILLVIRSPYQDYCGTFTDTDAYADGTEKGPLLAPTLPPEIVAAMGRCNEEEILAPYTTRSWREADAR